MSEWGYVGKHRTRIDGDIFISINDGPVSLVEMKTMMVQIDTAVEKQGVRFFLMDLTRAEPPSPDARRWMAQNPQSNVEAVAAYGASRTLRFMSDLMRRAMEVLHRSTPRRAPFRIFVTEAEARAHLNELRYAPK
jgi:hypothetical protein